MKEALSGPSRRGVTLRAVLLGLVLIPLNLWWLTEIEFVRYSDSPTIPALFFNAVAMLLLLILGNAGLRRLWPRQALSRSEMLVVYAMVAIATNVAGHDQLQILFPTLIYIYRYATPENHWAERIHPLLPRRIMVSEEGVLKALFQGHSTLYTPERLHAWVLPVTAWSLFAMLLAGVMYCFSALFRRQWDAERLNYPIAEIPLQVSSPGFFRRPAMWAGFGLAASLQLLNLLHSLFPVVPGVPIQVHYYQASALPWSAAGAIPVSFFPFAVGLTFLLPVQLGFSCWFFFLLSRAEMVLSAVFGHYEWDRFPYVNQQSAGAYFGFCFFAFWAGRVHFAQVWRGLFCRERWRWSSEAEEPLPYNWAVVGVVGGTVLLILWGIALGMSGLVAAVYIPMFLAIVIGVARLRAELGLPTVELYQRGADDILLRIAGTNAFSRGDLTGFSLCFWMNRTHRQFPMQTQVDALRIGRHSYTPLRPFTWALLLATGVGIFGAFWMYLHVMYRVGFESAQYTGPALWAFGRDPWDKLSRWLTVPQEPDLGAVGAYIFGLSFTLLLVFLRTRFVWWPLHPAGYLVAGSFALMRLWVPLFLSWLIKTLLLRYGGLKAYRGALPFFLGLIVGEFSAGFLRTVLDLAFNLYLPAESGIGGL